ncbi:MAG: class III signal peptide-containing protein [DPANN group archaeon]|nr:class III signal peptide-containing protein [DPANN group archaeon]
MSGTKGQGSLEYLFIIAGVLAVAAIAVLFLTSAGAGAAQSQLRATCVAAAQQCGSLQLTQPGVTCPNTCGRACSDPRTGTDVLGIEDVWNVQVQQLAPSGRCFNEDGGEILVDGAPIDDQVTCEDDNGGIFFDNNCVPGTACYQCSIAGPIPA